MNKTESLTALAEASGLSKQQVADLFQHLAGLIAKNLAADGPGSFQLLDLLQLKVVRKPAVAEHMGVHPITKQEMLFKAKPAKNAVKVAG